MSNLKHYVSATGTWEEIKVSTRFTDLLNTVKLTQDQNNVSIGITNFNTNDDVIFVYLNSTWLQKDEDYILNDGLLRIESKDGSNWKNGDTFNFVILKNVDKDAVPTADGSLIQDGSITIAKLATSIQNYITKVGTATLSTTANDLSGAINEINDKVVQLSNPNLLINGDFQVWQRGASFAIPHVLNTYTADRWSITATGTTINISSNSEGGLNIINSTSLTANTRFGQIIELPRSLQNIPMTLTLNLKSSVNQSVMISVCSYDGTTRNVINSKYINLTNVATSYNLSFNAPTTTYLYVCIVLSCATSDYLGSTSSITLQPSTITNYWNKLEVGDKATPFVPRLYAEELALCQRYYEKIYMANIYALGGGNAITLSCSFNEKRVIPTPKLLNNTIMIYCQNTASSITSSNSAVSNTSLSIKSINYLDISGFSGLSTSNLYKISSATSIIELDSEIY